MVDRSDFRDPEYNEALAAALRGDLSQLEALNAARRKRAQSYPDELRAKAEEGAARYIDPRMQEELSRAAQHATDLINKTLER
jgi:dTDP-4-amino-4,6-dideoxygalactose transaminase